MDDLIKQKLTRLFALLSNPAVKSKQAAFNACYDELTQVRELSSWETIVDIIKQETSIDIDCRTASNMYGRTRRKFELKNVRVNEILVKPCVDETEQAPSPNDEKKKVNNPADLREIRNRKIDLDDLKNGD